MKVIIIGGVAGGASLAARLRRRDENVEIVLFERGEYVSYANCGLPYYLGGVIQRRDDLFLHTVESLSTRFNFDIRNLTEVISIDPKAQTVTARHLPSGKETTEHYDTLVLATGAEPIRPPVAGGDDPRIFTLRSVADTDRIKSFLSTKQPKTAVVVGGGFIGLEMVENLNHAGVHTTVVEKAPQVMAPLDPEMAAIVHRHLRRQRVELRLGVGAERYEAHNDGLHVYLEDGTQIVTDMVILSIGVRPETTLARGAGLLIGERGGIRTDEYMQTSDPNIYAIGDAAEVINPITGRPTLIPLAGPANKQARIVADNIIDGNQHVYVGTIGTSIAQVMGLTVTATGMSSKLLTREGIPHISSCTHSGSHAEYYPGSSIMHLLIHFSPTDGTLLGAQVVGREGVDKRIEMLAAIIKQGGTIYDLQELEHAYAPPYSSAKDPVNIAGQVAGNILDGQMQIVHVKDLSLHVDALLLDVRTVAEYRYGHIPNAINIPLEELRNRLYELPLDKEIIIYCAVGQRGYLAARILMQHGYSQVYNLSGGYTSYRLQQP